METTKEQLLQMRFFTKDERPIQLTGKYNLQSAEVMYLDSQETGSEMTKDLINDEWGFVSLYELLMENLTEKQNESTFTVKGNNLLVDEICPFTEGDDGLPF